jgi:hypothetical protein
VPVVVGVTRKSRLGGGLRRVETGNGPSGLRLGGDEEGEEGENDDGNDHESDGRGAGRIGGITATPNTPFG